MKYQHIIRKLIRTRATIGNLLCKNGPPRTKFWYFQSLISRNVIILIYFYLWGSMIGTPFSWIITICKNLLFELLIRHVIVSIDSGMVDITHLHFQIKSWMNCRQRTCKTTESANDSITIYKAFLRSTQQHKGHRQPRLAGRSRVLLITS